MKRFFFGLSLVLLTALLTACGKSPPPLPSAALKADPHAIEQKAMQQGSPDFSNLLIVRLQSNGQRVEITSVLPATIAVAKFAGEEAKTIFRVNENGNGLILFSRDLPNGKSSRIELSLSDLEGRKSFSFPVVQPDASLKERTFTLEKVVRQL